MSEREREGGGELQRNRQKEVVGRKTQSTRKRDYWDRKTGSREQERERAGKDCPPPPPPAIPRLYLSKESSVLTQELKPLSPRAGALCPGAPASFGAGGCGAWLASAKLAVSVRDNCQITVLLNVPATGGMICPLSLPPSLFSFHPSHIRANRAPDLFSSGI